MTTYPGAPRTVRGGLVLVDPTTAQVRKVIALQYNPETVSRSVQVQGAGAEGGDRLEALRLKGPPVETIKVEASIDATDQLEHPNEHPDVVRYGLHPVIAAIETMVYPESTAVQANISSAAAGTLEITPVQGPLTLFVWSAQRVVPVRVTELSITEEMFDPDLNPIRATVSLGLRVLTVNDLPLGHRGAGISFAHHRQLEQLARGVGGEVSQLGIRRVP